MWSATPKAAALDVAPSSVRLVNGARSRLKRFEVSGVAAETMARTLDGYRRAAATR